jgi:hypothetical protein
MICTFEVQDRELDESDPWSGILAAMKSVTPSLVTRCSAYLERLPHSQSVRTVRTRYALREQEGRGDPKQNGGGEAGWEPTVTDCTHARRALTSTNLK